jgi:GTPase involved in cell partitioning and DNA repair
MTLARQEEIIVETLETVISIDLSEKRLLTMIGNVKSVIILIFHLGLNVIDAENPNQVVEVIAETVDHAETTVQDEIIEVAAETADHAETTVLEEREAHAENADHVETTAHPEKEAHAESVDQAGIVVEVTESVDQEEKEAAAKSETQPFVNSAALEVNHLVMRTTEDPNPLILVH